MATGHGDTPWGPAPLPPSVGIGRMPAVEDVNLSRLAPERKRAVWQHLQGTAPAYARLLAEDANLHALRAAFDADVMLPREALDGLD